MATGSFLPPVVTRLTMNIDDFISGVAKAKAAKDALAGDIKFDVDINMAAASAKMATYDRLVQAATVGQRYWASAIRDTNDALRGQAEALAEVNPLITSMSRRLATATAWSDRLGASAADTRNALLGLAAAGGAAGLGGAGAAAGGGGGGWGGWGWLTRDVPLWGGAFGSTYMIGRISAWHLALDGVLETTIAIVSATIAVGAGLAAMSAAAQDVYTRLSAIQAINGSFGTNIAPSNGQWQQIQQMAAGPTIGAYGGLMALLGNASQYAGSLQQITDGIDSVVARLDIYQKSQSGFNGVLQHGMGYASQFSDILGNLGKTFSNFMAAEPGTAHYLMDFISGLSSAIAWLTHFNGVVKTVLGAHAIISYGGALYSLTRNLLGRLPLVGTAIRAAMGNPYVAAATVAVGLLALNWDKSTRAIGGYIAAQDQLIAQMQPEGAVNAIPGLIRANMGQIKGLNPQDILNSEKGWNGFLGNAGPISVGWLKQLGHNLGPNGGLGTPGGNPVSEIANLLAGMFGNSSVNEQYNQDIANLQAHIQKLSGEWTNLYGAAAPLIKQGYSMQQAFSLEALAGVNAGDSFQVMTQKIQNLIRGYGDLGNNAGMLTNSINAVDFAAEQQSSKISQVTQGWSTFLGMLTGGTTAFGTVEQQLIGLYQTTTTGATSISVANGKVSASTAATASKVSASIGGLSSTTLQMYSTFANGISDAGNAINQLFTLDSAASLGAQGVRLVTQGSKDLVAQFLPAAKSSQLLTTMLYGLAQQGGYQGANSFKALAQWIGNVKNPSLDYLNVLTKLTGAAGNLATDVKNLANAIDPQMTSAMSGAIIAASGGTRTLENFANAVLNSHGNADALTRSSRALWQQMIEVYGHTGQAKNQFEAFAVRLGIAQGAADRLWNDLQASGGKTSFYVIRDIQAIQAQLNGLQTNKTITITTYHQDLFTTRSQVAPGVSSPSVLRAAGYASGTSGASRGWAWVGEKGPELVNFRGGETVIPNQVARGYAGGTGDDTVHEIHVYLDGREIFGNTQSRAVATQRRTGSSGLNKRTR